jgi:hypothetical protein
LAVDKGEQLASQLGDLTPEKQSKAAGEYVDGWPQGQSSHVGEKKNLVPLLAIKPHYHPRRHYIEKYYILVPQ